MSRRLSLKVGQGNALVLARIQALKADHPFWGYRRIWAQLRFAEGLAVNKKRILRLMREHGLLVRGNPRCQRRCYKSSNQRTEKSSEHRVTMSLHRSSRRRRDGCCEGRTSW